MKTTLTASLALLFMVTLLNAADETAGKAAYDKACRSCHGADGTPNAKIASALKVEMLHLGANEVQSMSDDELKKIIVEGKGKMKPVKSLPAKSVDDVVAYMRTFKK